ncbi:MAG: acyl-CoA dehydrogenase family protein [Thermoanaerobaculia bacterium]
MSKPKTKEIEEKQGGIGAEAPVEATGPAFRRGGAFLVEPVVGPVFSREQFSEEQKEIDRMVREFAAERIAPRMEELSTHNKELTLELMREVAELGLTGIDVPEKYGGLELDKTTSGLVVEALTTGGSASWVVTFSCHVGIGTVPIVYFGSEEQKAKYLPKLASAEWLGAYALTEQDSGSDVAELKTTARPTEDGEAYLLNGTKLWITNGGWADTFIVFADLEGAGNTAFIVEREWEGLSTGAEEHKLGIKGSSTVTVILQDVRVPKENLLGEPGKGLPVALNSLNIGRFKLGAADLGGCKGTITNSVQYALERQQFGQPIAYFEAIRKKFAEMVVGTYTLDSAIYRAVGLMDERIAQMDTDDPEYDRHVMDALEEYAIESSIGKIFGSEAMAMVADHGVQIHGGNGYSEEYPIAGIYRDCRIDRIFEGTNEINRMVIYGYFLKKALMEELPFRDAEKLWSKSEVPDDGPLAWEVAALDAARRLTVKSLFEAVSLYGQDLRNAQIVGEDLADLAIGYFGASAAINRILQLGDKERGDRVYRALARLVVSTYMEEVVRRLYRLRPVLFSGPYGSRFVDQLDRELQQLYPPFDPVKEVHILTDDLFEHGRYRFE